MTRQLVPRHTFDDILVGHASGLTDSDLCVTAYVAAAYVAAASAARVSALRDMADLIRKRIPTIEVPND